MNCMNKWTYISSSAETPNVMNFENRCSYCSVAINQSKNFFIHIFHDLLHKVLINVKNLERSEMLPCWQANDRLIQLYGFWKNTWNSWDRDKGLQKSQQAAFVSCLPWYYLLPKLNRVIQSDVVVAVQKQWLLIKS